MSKQSLSPDIIVQLAPEVVAQVHSSLLQWYQAGQRDLPWRSTADPYAILVSEIMLQQTQVDRVLPKYQQFLAAFPTLTDLAQAYTADIITVWVPLGYNRRAVSLQAIARQVIAEYGGRIPDTIDELLKLKGIGRYTAGAIACFAYGKQVATVDTNIRRVLHRVFFGLELPEPKLNDAQMLPLAEQVLPAAEAYHWNQALMDLGATFCTSSNPLCTDCPLQESCCAYTEMKQHSLFPSGTVMRQLRKVAENQTLAQQEFNRAFVLMQYFGYLRRNPNDAPDSDFSGYTFWLMKLNQFNGDYQKAEMVKAFITSTEYRQRFGP